MPLDKLSVEDQQYVLKNHGYFTGIRCEYQDVSIDGKLKNVFLIKEILPESPADKAKTGWTQNSLHSFYFRPIGLAAKPENIIDGFFHAKTPEFSFIVSSTGSENYEIVRVNCISKQDWDKAEDNRLAREAAEKMVSEEKKRKHREENRERLAQEREEIDVRVQAARQSREIKKREQEAERMQYAQQQRQVYEQRMALLEQKRENTPPPSSSKKLCTHCESYNGKRKCRYGPCQGAGFYLCNSCKGSGKSGSYGCFCDAGKIKCSSCKGTGLVTCYHTSTY